jgi:prophage antirepressor-like protein
MNANIIPFVFEGAQVRVIDRDGNPWWALVDVCSVLEIRNPWNVGSRLDEDEKGLHSMETPGGFQDQMIISEPGLYKLIGTSRKPRARRFDRWVRHEVLPTLRKTGRYVMPGAEPGGGMTREEFFNALDKLGKEWGERTGVRFDNQDKKIEDVKKDVGRIETKVDLIANELDKRRRKITPITQQTLLEDLKLINGGRCPCGCGRMLLDTFGMKLPVCRFDHFYTNSLPDADHSWPLHEICHDNLTYGRVARHEREASFRHFQDARKRLPLQQKLLFKAN